MAQDNSLLEKLEALRLRFEEVGQMITDPAVIADQKRYVKLNKEYRELEEIVEMGKQYKNLVDNIDSSRKMLKEEDDEEMRALAREELDELEEKKPEMEEKLKCFCFLVILKIQKMP
nr:PCRF domain-containing protein [Anaerophaga thermohalophila]